MFPKILAPFSPFFVNPFAIKCDLETLKLKIDLAIVEIQIAMSLRWILCNTSLINVFFWINQQNSVNTKSSISMLCLIAYIKPSKAFFKKMIKNLNLENMAFPF